MSDDLVERLRGFAWTQDRERMALEAADEIERLRAKQSENAWLKAENEHLRSREAENARLQAEVMTTFEENGRLALEVMRLRAALKQIDTVCVDNSVPTARFDLALGFVRQVAAKALDDKPETASADHRL